MLADRLLATPRPGAVIDGRYRVERPLGTGGMGAVVAATHLELRQEVAIKVLLPTVAKSEEANARFLREGRAAARLTSPYAAKVFDTGRLPSGEPYLVMELLAGRDLRSHMATTARVSLEQAAEWVLQAAHALGEAHRLHVIHRDVKPANLFLAETSAGTIVKVLDFGVSKQADDGASDLTNTAAILGTPRYMAPEQMRSARLADQRCDVWSLGVVLYELTTGEAPFRGDSVTALCFDVMERTPIPPSHHCPELPPAFDAFMARCLAKDPDERFPTMEELAESLRAFAPTARTSLLLGTMETPSNPLDGPPQSSMPGATVGARMLASESQSTSSRRGLRAWLLGAGIAFGVTGAAAIALAVSQSGGGSALSATPSPLPSSEGPRTTTSAEDRARAVSSVEASPDIVVAPSAEPPTSAEPTASAEPTSSVVSAVEAATPSAQTATATGAARRPPGALCDPPTWRDKNNRLVPKPYCL